MSIYFAKLQGHNNKLTQLYSNNIIRQPPGSRIEKRQCDVIMTSLAPQKDHPKNDVFGRFSWIKVLKNVRFFFLENTPVTGKSILYLTVAISFMTLF